MDPVCTAYIQGTDPITDVIFFSSHFALHFRIRFPASQAILIPPAVKAGFEFHHALPGHVMMCKWISSSPKNMLPAFATTTMGVGAFVINEKRFGALFSPPYM